MLVAMDERPLAPMMASTVLTKPSTGVKGTTGKKGWRLAGHTELASTAPSQSMGRDAHQEAVPETPEGRTRTEAANPTARRVTATG